MQVSRVTMTFSGLAGGREGSVMRMGVKGGGWFEAAMWEGRGGTEGGSSEEEDEWDGVIDLGSLREERLERVRWRRGVGMTDSPWSCLSSSSPGRGRGGRGGLVGGESGARLGILCFAW